MSSSGSGGFWKRVGSFVKNPTRDWALTDEQALQEHENREKAKARDDRKRQDDFIRKRELDGLRRLRKRELTDLPMDDSLQTDVPDITAPPAGAAGRDETLRKINEIERSMSSESLIASAKSRFAPSRPMTRAPMTQAPVNSPYATTTLDSSLGAGKAPATDTPPATVGGPATTAAPAVLDTLPLEPRRTVPPVTPPPAADDQLTVAAATRLSPDAVIGNPPPSGESWLRSSNDFVPSAFFAVEVHEALSSNPLFDQAVMDFANGDDAAAESALREAISNCSDLDSEKELWLALFDLFRAAGQIYKFEALVTDFVGRFQTSAPMAEDGLSTAAPATAPAAAAAFKPSLVFSATLDVAQAERLRKLLLGNPAALELNFSEMRAIAPAALPVLGDALHKLNQTRADVTLRGSDGLLALCAASAPAMQRDADVHWWTVRLELLRLLGQQEDFDAIALDYCVTYEISPPAWEPSLARVESDDQPSGQEAAAAGSATEYRHSALGQSTLGPGSTMTARLQLDGEIVGGSGDFLSPLDKAAKLHDQLSVSMRGLRRIDFSSAGALLNWAMLQHGAGKTLHFTGVHRLIAGLFSILGLHEHALIQLRRD